MRAWCICSFVCLFVCLPPSCYVTASSGSAMKEEGSCVGEVQALPYGSESLEIDIASGWNLATNLLKTLTSCGSLFLMYAGFPSTSQMASVSADLALSMLFCFFASVPWHRCFFDARPVVSWGQNGTNFSSREPDWQDLWCGNPCCLAPATAPCLWKNTIKGRWRDSTFTARTLLAPSQ